MASTESPKTNQRIRSDRNLSSSITGRVSSANKKLPNHSKSGVYRVDAPSGSRLTWVHSRRGFRPWTTRSRSTPGTGFIMDYTVERPCRDRHGTRVLRRGAGSLRRDDPRIPPEPPRSGPPGERRRRGHAKPPGRRSLRRAPVPRDRLQLPRLPDRRAAWSPDLPPTPPTGRAPRARHDELRPVDQQSDERPGGG